MKSEKEILDERARINAIKNKVGGITAVNAATFLEFRIVPEQYAIEEKFVTEVLSLRNLTLIPGTPSFVQGVINYRGRILSVVNIKIFLNKREKGLGEMNKLIVISDGKMEYGIVADNIAGLREIDLDSIGIKPLNLDPSSEEFIMGVMPDGVVLLDGEILLKTSKIIIK